MPTRTSVHAAIDTKADAVFAGINLLKGNQVNLAFSEGTLPYIRERVIFTGVGQLYLGNTKANRKTGSIVFTLFVRKGSGDGDRNRLADMVTNNFCNTQIGGATFWGSRELPYGDTENWCLSGIQIPFYFDEE